MTEEPKSRETRLGLVLYGGVALAIYMNGITQEIYRAHKASRTPENEPTVYSLIRDLTDTDVTVDIVSGASAGGINGIMLAYAIVNQGSNIEKTRQTWLEAADLSELLHEITKLDHISLFRSEEFYVNKLAEAFAAINSGAKTNSDVELDLFIAATDLEGQRFARVDADGREVQVKEHAAVFHLRKNGIVNDFESTADNRARLAKLSAVTSAFPVAFAPVRVDKLEDPVLWEWGRLGNAESPRCYVDGGVLDNRPFSHTVEAIYYRRADRPVKRKLLYLEPDPEKGPTPSTFRNPQPDILKNLGGTVGVVTYESIFHDLESLDRRNRYIGRYKRLWDLVSTEKETPPDPQTLRFYQKCRVLAMSERIVGCLARSESVPRETKKTAFRILYHAFDAVIARQIEDESLFDEHFETIAEVDVDFRKRQLFHLIYGLYDYLTTNISEEAREKIQSIVRQCYDLLQLIRELEFVLEGILFKVHVPGLLGFKGDTDEALAAYLKNNEAEAKERAEKAWFLLFHELRAAMMWERAYDDCKPVELPAKLRKKIPKVFEKINLREKEYSTYRKDPKTLLQDIDDKIQRFVSNGNVEVPEHTSSVERKSDSQKPLAETVGDLVQAFQNLDPRLFAAEWFGDLKTRDQIELYRVSPDIVRLGIRDRVVADVDPTRLPSEELKKIRAAQTTLAGETLAHFGGFLQKHWRANDILWGRLDGVSKLVELLLGRDEMKRLARNSLELDKHWKQWARACSYEEEADKNWNRLNENWKRFCESKSEDAFGDFRNEVVALAQQKILKTELNTKNGETLINLWKKSELRESCRTILKKVHEEPQSREDQIESLKTLSIGHEQPLDIPLRVRLGWLCQATLVFLNGTAERLKLKDNSLYRSLKLVIYGIYRTTEFANGDRKFWHALKWLSTMFILIAASLGVVMSIAGQELSAAGALICFGPLLVAVTLGMRRARFALLGIGFGLVGVFCSSLWMRASIIEKSQRVFSPIFTDSSWLTGVFGVVAVVGLMVLLSGLFPRKT